MKILAIDPGGTTGYAWGILDGQSPMRFRTEQHKYLHNDYYNFLVNGEPDYIVYETFEYRNRARAGLELISAELIGITLLYISERLIPFASQTASEHGAGGKTGYFNNRKLKELGFYKTKPHEMDALRILLNWHMFKKGHKYFHGDPVEAS